MTLSRSENAFVSVTTLASVSATSGEAPPTIAPPPEAAASAPPEESSREHRDQGQIKPPSSSCEKPTAAAIVDGGRLVATIPIVVATQILQLRPHLRMSAIPFRLEPGSIDLLWPRALDVDPACRFVREAIVRIADARREHWAKPLRGSIPS